MLSVPFTEQGGSSLCSLQNVLELTAPPMFLLGRHRSVLFLTHLVLCAFGQTRPAPRSLCSCCRLVRAKFPDQPARLVPDEPGGPCQGRSHSLGRAGSKPPRSDSLCSDLFLHPRVPAQPQACAAWGRGAWTNLQTECGLRSGLGLQRGSQSPLSARWHSQGDRAALPVGSVPSQPSSPGQGAWYHQAPGRASPASRPRQRSPSRLLPLWAACSQALLGDPGAGGPSQPPSALRLHPAGDQERPLVSGECLVCRQREKRGQTLLPGGTGGAEGSGTRTTFFRRLCSDPRWHFSVSFRRTGVF